MVMQHTCTLVKLSQQRSSADTQVPKKAGSMVNISQELGEVSDGLSDNRRSIAAVLGSALVVDYEPEYLKTATKVILIGGAVAVIAIMPMAGVGFLVADVAAMGLVTAGMLAAHAVADTKTWLYISRGEPGGCCPRQDMSWLALSQCK